MDPLQLQSPRTFIRGHKASATEGPGKCHDEVTTLGWEAQAFFERHSHLVLKHWAAPKNTTVSSWAAHWNQNGSCRMEETTDGLGMGVGVVVLERLQGRDRIWARSGWVGSFV